MKVWKRRWAVCVSLMISLLLCGHAAFGQQTGVVGRPDSREQLYITLEEVINLALQNNLKISIEQYNPEIKKEDILKAESAFDSTLTNGLFHTFNESDSNTTPTGISSIEAGISRRVASGGSYKLAFTTSVSQFNGTTAATVPDPETGQPVSREIALKNEYANSLQVQYVQPILRNFGTDVNTTQIKIAGTSRDISVSQLRATVIDVLTRVKTAYWNLVNAVSDLEAKKQSLQLVYDLVKINEAQVNVGTLAPIEVLQAKAQAASREVDVTAAELAVLNAEDQLKRLLNFSRDDPIWAAAIVPADRPTEEQYPISLQEAIETALANREELKQLQHSIRLQEYSLSFAENQLKPELNLIGKLGVSGKDESYGDALGELSGFKTFGVTVGANFSYPIGNRTAKSGYNQARLQLEQQKLSSRDLEQLISVDVRVTLRSVDTAYNLIRATRIARELSEEQLNAEQKKFNEGLSTNFQVLDYQDKLTQARTREALAITAYNKALVDLDRATGMTLQRHNIVIQE